MLIRRAFCCPFQIPPEHHFLCVISLVLLVTYIFWFSTPLVFNVGIMIFQMSLLFSVEFLICGIVVDSLKKRLI